MSDRPLDMLVVRDMPDGTFTVADALPFWRSLRQL